MELSQDQAEGIYLEWPAQSTAFFAWILKKDATLLLRRWDATTFPPEPTNLDVVREAPHTFSPSGRWMVSREAGLFDLRNPSSKPTARLIDTKSKGAVGWNEVRFSPDERHVALLARSSSGMIYPVAVALALHRISGDGHTIELVTIRGKLDRGPDGFLKPTATADLLFTGGGRWLVLADDGDSSFQVYDLTAAAPRSVRIPPPRDGSALRFVKASEDRRFALLTASPFLSSPDYLYDMDSPETPARPVGDALCSVFPPVRSFRVSPDKQWMIIESSPPPRPPHLSDRGVALGLFHGPDPRNPERSSRRGTLGALSSEHENGRHLEALPY